MYQASIFNAKNSAKFLGHKDTENSMQGMEETG